MKRIYLDRWIDRSMHTVYLHISIHWLCIYISLTKSVFVSQRANFVLIMQSWHTSHSAIIQLSPTYPKNRTSCSSILTIWQRRVGLIMCAVALTPITHGPCVWCANYSAGRMTKIITSNLLPLIIDKKVIQEHKGPHIRTCTISSVNVCNLLTIF